MIHIDLTGALPFLPQSIDYAAVAAAHDTLWNKTGAGNDFLGWPELPERIRSTELERIEKAAKTVRSKGDVLVVIGIGGSYLGARAAYELLGRKANGVELLFAGNGLSPLSLRDTLEKLGDRDFCVNVVSKSGTTLEPALAFRIFRELLEKKYGPAEARTRIFATTDKCRGALKSQADAAGWESFIVPDDVGGRYSVLSAVGLLPMACAGHDIRTVLTAAENAFAAFSRPGEDNPVWQYAGVRQGLYKEGKLIEVLACYEPRFRMMAEWWKQLYGESEGKDGLGIFPASVEFNADLHSMGQYMQDGPRHMMETVVSFEADAAGYVIPADSANADGLGYIAGHDLSEIARIARLAVRDAHVAGALPNIGISVPALDEAGFGELVAFFETACGVSGYMEGVNPFDQPGVEAYKKNMFRMLGDWK